MKKKVSLVLVLALVLSIFCISGYAYGSKKFVPPGLAKKGGLPPGLAKKGKLPPGWEKKVNDVEEQEEEEEIIEEEIIEEIGLKGTIKEVTEDTLKIQMNAVLFTLEIEEGTQVKINGEDKSLEDLYVGDVINIKIDDAHKLIEIDEVNINNTRFVTGKLLGIEDEDTVVVKVNDHIKTYTLAEDVAVYVDGRLKTLDDLEENEIIKFKVEDNKVVYIQEYLEEKFEGKLIKIESGFYHQITILLKDERKTFILDEDVEIEDEDGEEIDFVELLDEIESQVKIETENNKVVFIEIEE